MMGMKKRAKKVNGVMLRGGGMAKKPTGMKRGGAVKKRAKSKKKKKANKKKGFFSCFKFNIGAIMDDKPK